MKELCALEAAAPTQDGSAALMAFIVLLQRRGSRSSGGHPALGFCWSMKAIVSALSLCAVVKCDAAASVVDAVVASSTGTRSRRATVGSVGDRRAASIVNNQALVTAPRVVAEHNSRFLHRRPARPYSEETEQPAEVQQEVERMMTRVKRLGDPEAEAKYVSELANVEAALADTRAGITDKNLANEIAAVRASLCEQQGFAQHETADCDSFMRKACPLQETPRNTPKRKALSPVSDAQCAHFFQAELKVAGDGGITNNTATNPNVSVPVPAGGLFGSKKGRPLPSQGYNEYGDGEVVEHDNSTATADWQKEFGSWSGRRDVYAICRDFPDNEWCRLHSFHKNPHKSGATPSGRCSSTGLLVFFLSVVLPTLDAA